MKEPPRPFREGDDTTAGRNLNGALDALEKLYSAEDGKAPLAPKTTHKVVAKMPIGFTEEDVEMITFLSERLGLRRVGVIRVALRRLYDDEKARLDTLTDRGLKPLRKGRV